MSFMNGLSALGAGVAQFAGTAALEAQKADLAKQTAILADQLATTRGTTLQAQAGDIAATAAGKQQEFAQGQQSRQLAATASEGALTREAEMARTQATINAPPEAIKTLNYLGVPLPGGATTPTATPTAPASTTDTTAAPSDSAAAVAPAPAAAAASTPAASTPVSPLVTNLINKTLGQPMSGSEAASRYAIAQDVNSDPAFKYATAGAKAAEIENRIAVATGKMTDPGSREGMAKAIASYQIAPLASFALTKPGGPETMAKVLEINPDYQEARYPEVSKAMGAFGSGKQADTVRYLNVGVQHLDLFDTAAQALGNGNVQVLNSLKNAFEQQFGVAEPTTFEGLKQLVGTEIEKAVSGGIGASSDRDRLMAALKSANSPAQLQAMTDGFRGLMLGQLAGLKTEYEDATGFKSGPFAFDHKLVPATMKALGGHSGTSTPAAPPAPADTTATTYNEFGASAPPTPAAPKLPALPSGFRILQ